MTRRVSASKLASAMPRRNGRGPASSTLQLHRCSLGSSDVEQERVSLREEEESGADPGSDPEPSSKGQAVVHPQASPQVCSSPHI